MSHWLNDGGSDSLRIQHHEADGNPVAGSAAPPLWIRLARTSIEFVALSEDLVLLTAVALIGCHIPDCAVSMLAVVPADKAGHPSLSARRIGKRNVRIRWCVLEGSEECFRVRVIVGDMRSTERWNDAEPL